MSEEVGKLTAKWEIDSQSLRNGLRKAEATLKNWSKKNSPLEISAELDTSNLNRSLGSVTRTLTSWKKSHGKVGVSFEVNDRSLTAGLAKAAKQVESFKSSASAKLDVDTSTALKKITSLNRRMTSLRGTTIAVKFEASGLSGVIAGLEQVRSARDDVNGSSASVNVDQFGAAPTVGSLGTVKRAAESVDGQNAMVRVSQSGIPATVAALGAFRAATQSGRHAVNEFNRQASTMRNVGMVAARAGITSVVGALGPLTAGATVGGSALASLAGGYGLVYAAASPTLKILGEYGSVLNDLTTKQRASMSVQEEAAYVQRKLAEEGINLTDSQRGVVEGAIRLGDTYSSSFAKATEATDKLMIRGLDLANRVLPFLGKQATENVGAMSRAFDALGKSAEEPAQVRIYERFFSRLPSMTQTATQAMGSFGLGLFNILEGAQPYAQDLLGWLSRVGNVFASWTRSAGGQKSIKQFLEDSIPVAKNLASALGSVVTGLFKLSTSKSALSFFDNLAKFIGYVGDNLPKLTPVFDVLNRAAEIIDSMPKPLKDAAFQAGAFYLAFQLLGGGFLVGIARGVGTFVGAIVKIAPSFARIGGVLSKVMPFFARLGGAFTRIVPLVARFVPWLARVALIGAVANPIGLVVTAVGLLATGFVMLYRRSETFRNAVHAVAGVVSGLLVNAFNNAKEVFGPVVGFFGRLGGGLLSKAGEKLGELGTKVGEFFSWIGEKAQNHPGLSKVWEKLSDDRGAVDSAKEKLGPFFSWIGEKAGGNEGLQRVWKKLKDDRGAVDSAKEKIGPLFSWISEKAQTPGMQRIWGKLKDDRGAVDVAKEKLGTFFSWLGEKTGAGPGLGRIWNKLRDDKGAVENVKERLGGFFAWLSDKMNGSPGLSRIWIKLRDDKGAIQNVREKLGGLLTWIGTKAEESKGLSKIWTRLKDDKGAIENTRERLGGLFTWIGTKASESKGFDRIWTKLRDDKGAVQNVREKFGQVKTSITTNSAASARITGQKFGQIYNSVSSKMAKSKSSTVRNTGELLQDVRGKWNSTEGSTREKFTAIRDMIGDRMREGKTRATDRMKELGSNMVDRAKRIRGNIKDAFQGIRDWMTNPIKTARDTLKSVWNDILGGIGKVLGDVGMKDLSEKVSGAKWARGGTTEDGGGQSFARGGVVERFASGGMGTGGANPRMHLWNEQQGGEAFIAEKRPAGEQLPYLQTAAGWHGYAVVPANPAKQVPSNHRCFDNGGVAPYPLQIVPFNLGGASEMHAAVLKKFGVDGFNNHASYLPEPSASRSIDWMVTQPGNRASGSEKELGDRIASFTAPPSAKNTIWYGRANFGAGWEGYSTGPGVGNSNTLGHYDHIHAEANSGSFAGGQGGGGSFGGISVPNPKQIAFEAGWKLLAKPLFDRARDLIDGEMVLRKAGAKTVDTIRHGLYGFIDNKIPDTIGGSDGTTPGVGGGDPAKNRELGRKMLGSSGVGGSFSSLDSLWTKESGWNQLADNPTSDAYGIPQGMMGAGGHVPPPGYMPPKSDPGVQIAWGLDYIRKTYGSTDEAWGHSQSNNWYGKGGIIPGMSGEKKMVLAHAGERVLPRDVVTSFDRLASSIQLWSARTSVTGATPAIEVNQSAEVYAKALRQSAEQVAELKAQTKIMQRQQQVLVQAVVAGVVAAPKSAGFQGNLDDLFAAAAGEDRELTKGGVG